jgi:hypothetical protein
MLSDFSSTLTISSLALSEIKLFPSPSTPSANFEFSLTASLYDQLGDPWTSDESLSLTGDFVTSPLVSTSTAGVSVFTLKGH